MKINLTYKDLIYVVIIASLLAFIFKKDDPSTEDQVSRLKDSIYMATSLKHKEAADSLIKLSESKDQEIIILNKNDSIIRYKYAKERAKNRRNTDTDRKRITDSLFRTSGIRIK